MMDLISVFAERITARFIRSKIITEEDGEVYKYGFELLFSTVLNGIIVLIIALLSKTFLPCLCFVTAFIFIRRTAGGYHSKTHLGCCATLVAVMAAFIILLYNLSEPTAVFFTFLFTAFSAIIILLLAPTEHENQPLEPEAKRALRKKCFVYLSFLITAICLFVILKFSMPAFSIAAGLFTACCSCLALRLSSCLRLSRKTTDSQK